MSAKQQTYGHAISNCQDVLCCVGHQWSYVSCLDTCKRCYRSSEVLIQHVLMYHCMST